MFTGRLNGGGSYDDTLTGKDQANTWMLSGSDSGAVAQTIESPIDTVSFSGIETLQGGSSSDTFLLNASGSFDGSIDGGSGSDTIDGGNRTTDTSWSITGMGSGTVDGLDSGFVGIETLSGGSHADTFTVNANNVSEDWGMTFIGGDGVNVNDELVTTSSSGSTIYWDLAAVQRLVGTDEDSINGIVFSGIEKVSGGNGIDRFNLGAGTLFSGTLDAGGSVNDVLTGSSNASTWNITSEYGGNVTQNPTSVTLSFSGIEWINGGSDVDIFNLNTSTVSMSINGLGGPDIFNLGVHGTGTSYNFEGGLYGGAGEDRFNVLTANAVTAGIYGGEDTDCLSSLERRNSWIINRTGPEWVTGTLNTDIELDYIEELVGGESIDDFEITGTFSIDVNIDGGAGAAVDSLTGPSWQSNSPIVWEVNETGGTINSSIIFSNIELLAGGENDDIFNLNAMGTVSSIDGGDHGETGDTLHGPLATNTWDIDGEGHGTLSSNSQAIEFGHIENLTGNDNADLFKFNDGASLAGLIDGGEGGMDDDIVNVTDLGPVDVEEGDINAAFVNETDIRVNNIETLTAAWGSSLRGADVERTWVILSADTGTLGDMAFSGFSALRGGSGDDVFQINTSDSLAMSIDGGEEENYDSVDYSTQAGPINVRLGGNIFNGVDNAERIIGNGDNSTLTGTNTVNNWQLDGDNAGRITIGDDRIYFSGFNYLVGGSDSDTFNVINEGTIDGGISGGGGDDVLNVYLSQDSFTGNSLFFDGGDDTDTVNLSGGGARFEGFYETDDVSRELLRYTYDGYEYEIEFSGVEVTQDAIQADLLTINGTFDSNTITLTDISGENAFRVDGFSTIGYKNKNRLSVYGNGGADTVALEGTVDLGGGELEINVEEINGSGSIAADTLTLTNIQSAGSESARINIQAETLNVDDTVGAVYLEEENELTLGRFTAYGLFDLKSGGAVTSSTALTATDTFSLNAGGDIVLNNAGNILGGSITLLSDMDVVFENSIASTFDSIGAASLSITSGGLISGAGVVRIGGGSYFTADGSITFVNNANDFNSIVIDSASAVNLYDSNDLQLNGITVDGIVNINAAGNISNNSALSGTNISLGSSDGDVRVVSALTAQNGGDIHISAGDRVIVDGRLNSDRISLDAAGVIEQNTNIVAGEALDLNAGGGIVMASDVRSEAGQIHYTTVDSGDISLTVLSGNNITVTSGGSVNQSGNLSATNELNVRAGGDMVMSDGTESQADSISYTTTGGSMTLTALEGGSVTVNSAGAVNQSGNLSATNELNVQAVGDVVMLDGTESQANSISYTTTGGGSLSLMSLSGNNIAINSAGGIDQNSRLEAVGALTLQAAGDVAMSDGTSSQADSISYTTTGGSMTLTALEGGSVTVNSAGAVNQSGNLSATNELNVQAVGDVVMLAGTGSQADAISYSTTGTGSIFLESLGGNDIYVESVGDISQNSELDAVNELSMQAAGTIVMNSAGIASAGGNLSYSAGGNIAVNSILAGDTISLNSGGQIRDNNSDAVNLSAPRVELTAVNGIGSGVDNPLDLQTQALSAVNSGGGISLSNTGVISIEQLQNNGDINFTDNDSIYMASGSVNTDVGIPRDERIGTLEMIIDGGGFFGLGETDFRNPDITAMDARFIGPGFFGTFERPLVVDVTNGLIMTTARTITPFYPNGLPSSVDYGPGVIFDTFTALSALAGNQLVEVESLLEIDPAIFTPIRNYDYANIPIRLPHDQLYDE